MNRLVRCLLLFILFFGSLATYAQDNMMSRRSRDIYQNAQQAWKERNLDKALLFYQKLAELEPTLPEVHLRLAQLYEWQRKPVLTRYHYRQLVALNPETPELATAYQWLAKDTYQRESYDSAQTYYQKALPYYSEKSSVATVTKKQLANLQFAKKAMQSPLPVQKRSLGDTINFLQAQFFPVLTADNETIIYTGLTPARDENIYLARRTPEGWGFPDEISTAINSENNEGTCTISADGTTLVFTACNRRDGYGSCDLYFSKREGKIWQSPLNMGPVINSRFWESQPSLSADGSSLYFASDRVGGEGKADIWKSIRSANGEWSEPTNLGTPINTAEDENAPFIHANGRTLFYASNGHPGLGGFGLYLSQQEDARWSEPYNLGYPINTVSDQVGLFITADGRKAYYTDDRKDVKGRRALIFEFEVPETLRKLFVPTHFIKGRILDQKTGEPLQASLELYDLSSQEPVSTFTSQLSGDYLAVLNQNREHALYVSKEGYLFKSMTFASSDSTPSISLDILLERAEKDRIEVLSNIFFGTGKYALDEKSKVELQKLGSFLNNNPRLIIEISGHTDDIGSDKENMELSKQRAQSVTTYLVDYGIQSNRLSAVGYGKTKPKVSNTTEENRRLNRRIEWRIK